MYSKSVMDHYLHPRCRGDLAEPDATGEAEYHRCGDRLRLTFQIQEGRLAAVGFTAIGCGPAKAAGSATAEYLTGKTVEEARNVSAFALDELLGGLPISKRHALLMVLQCIHQALGPRQTT